MVSFLSCSQAVQAQDQIVLHQPSKSSFRHALENGSQRTYDRRCSLHFPLPSHPHCMAYQYCALPIVSAVVDTVRQSNLCGVMSDTSNRLWRRRSSSAKAVEWALVQPSTQLPLLLVWLLQSLLCFHSSEVHYELTEDGFPDYYILRMMSAMEHVLMRTRGRNTCDCIRVFTQN